MIQSEALCKIPRQNQLTMKSRFGPTVWLTLSDPAYYLRRHRHYAESELLRLLGAAGFKVLKIQLVGDILDAAAMNLLYIEKWLFSRKLHMIESIRAYFEMKTYSSLKGGRMGFQQIFLACTKYI